MKLPKDAYPDRAGLQTDAVRLGRRQNLDPRAAGHRQGLVVHHRRQPARRPSPAPASVRHDARPTRHAVARPGAPGTEPERSDRLRGQALRRGRQGPRGSGAWCFFLDGRQIRGAAPPESARLALRGQDQPGAPARGAHRIVVKVDFTARQPDAAKAADGGLPALRREAGPSRRGSPASAAGPQRIDDGRADRHQPGQAADRPVPHAYAPVRRAPRHELGLVRAVDADHASARPIGEGGRVGARAERPRPVDVAVAQAA